MKVNCIKLDTPFDFVIEQEDWECAPDPICMALVDEESWAKVAQRLEDEFKYITFNGMTDDDINHFFDDIWSYYENFVLEECRVFYYEDMTREEYNTYKSLDEDKREDYLEKVYNRIKNK